MRGRLVALGRQEHVEEGDGLQWGMEGGLRGLPAWVTMGQDPQPVKKQLPDVWGTAGAET